MNTRVPARQRDVASRPSALGADGFLGYLNDDLLTLSQQILDARAARRPRRLAIFIVVLYACTPLSFACRNQPAKIVWSPTHVRHVQVSRFFQTDIHKGRLHSRQDSLDPALVDVAGDATLLFALDVELGQQAVLHQRNASLGAVRVDDQKAVSHLGR
jgi:hypothetical protein